MTYRFNPPPQWDVPEGWTPPPGYRPDPSWERVPAGWNYWMPADAAPHVPSGRTGEPGRTGAVSLTDSDAPTGAPVALVPSPASARGTHRRDVAPDPEVRTHSRTHSAAVRQDTAVDAPRGERSAAATPAAGPSVPPGTTPQRSPEPRASSRTPFRTIACLIGVLLILGAIALFALSTAAILGAGTLPQSDGVDISSAHGGSYVALARLR